MSEGAREMELRAWAAWTSERGQRQLFRVGDQRRCHFVVWLRFLQMLAESALREGQEPKSSVNRIRTSFGCHFAWPAQERKRGRYGEREALRGRAGGVGEVQELGWM